MTSSMVPPGIGDPSLEALRHLPRATAGAEAARQLEVVFLTQLLQAMRKTVPDNDFLPRAPEHETWDGMFDHAVAESMARGDPLGIVRAMEARLKSEAAPTDNNNGKPEDVGTRKTR